MTETIEEVPFYHGTSRAGATALLNGESVAWFYEDARKLAQDIISLLLRDRNHLFETADLFAAAGIEDDIAAPLGLGQLVDGNHASAFSYGQLWLTTSFKMACEYALRNRHGSEAFAFLLDGLRVLDFMGELAGAELLPKYPRLHRLASMKHEPVVLSFRSLNCADLLGQHGNPVIANHVVNMLHNIPGVEFSDSYRLMRVEPAKALSVYDLADCLGSTSESALPSLGDLPAQEPRAWLSANTR